MNKSYHPNIGPGGIHCPCCRPIVGTAKKIKQFINRYSRRKAKQELDNE